MIFDLYLKGYSLTKISKELFNRNILTPTGKETRKTTRFSSGNTLSGKIKCAECGRNFRRITTHSGEIVWRCAGKVEGKTKCQAISLKQYVIDGLIAEKFGLISKDKSYEMIDSIIVDGEIININPIKSL